MIERNRWLLRFASLLVAGLGLGAMLTGQAVMECVVLEQASLTLAVLTL